jgi:hypothetical protein
VKIYIIIRDGKPEGAYGLRDDAKAAALAAATANCKATDHTWLYQKPADPDAESDRAELQIRSARRWISTGYVIDSTHLDHKKS